MKCARFRQLLIPYSEGSLSEERATSLERHLAECESCASELRSLARTADVLKKTDYPAFEPAVDLRARVMAEIADVKPVRRHWWQASRMQAYSAAMAGLLLVAIAGAGMWQIMARNAEVRAPSASVKQHSAYSDQDREQIAIVEPLGSPNVPDAVSTTMPSKSREQAPTSARTLSQKRSAHHPSAYMRLYAPSLVVGNAWTDKPGVEDARSLEFGSNMNLGSQGGLPTVDGIAKAERREDIALMLTQAAPGGTQTPIRIGPMDPNAGASAPPAAGSGASASSIDSNNISAESAQKAGWPEHLNNINGDRKKTSVVDDMPGRVNSALAPGTVLSNEIAGLEVKLRNFPCNVKVIGDLMERYRQAGRPRDEYNMAERLTRVDPDNARFWLSRAQAAERVPMRKTAELCYEQAIKMGLKGAELEQARGRVKALEASRK